MTYAITYTDSVAELITRASALADKYPNHLKLTPELKVIIPKVPIMYGPGGKSLGLVECKLSDVQRTAEEPNKPTFFEEVGMDVLNFGDDMHELYYEIERGVGVNLHPLAHSKYTSVIPMSQDVDESGLAFGPLKFRYWIVIAK